MQWWSLQDKNFNGTQLHQGDLPENFKENNLAKINCLKLQTQENPLNVFINLQLNKNNVELFPIKITSNKVIRNNVDISTKKITSKQVRGNNVEFLTSEITSKKVLGHNVDFSAIEITSKKIRGNNVDFPTIEITSKKVRGNKRGFLDQRNYAEKSRWKQL